LFEDEDNEKDGDDKKTKEKPKPMLSSRHKKRKGTYAEKKETIKKEDAEGRQSNFNNENKKSLVAHHTRGRSTKFVRAVSPSRRDSSVRVNQCPGNVFKNELGKHALDDGKGSGNRRAFGAGIFVSIEQDEARELSENVEEHRKVARIYFEREEHVEKEVFREE